MAPTSKMEYSQILGQNTTSSAHLRLNESANVDLHMKDTGPEGSGTEAVRVTTTATECSWNVYATAKLPRPTQVSNRAQLVDTTSNGQIVRVGNAFFIPQSGSSSGSLKMFTPSKFSMYIDSIERKDQYLFVTSRQDVTTIPEPQDESVKDESVKDVDMKSRDEKPITEDAKKTTDDTKNSSAIPADATTKGEKEDDSSDDDGPADKDSESATEDSSNELSADESWSEASTEYDSDQQIAEFRPVKPPQERVKPTSDSDSSSDLEESEASGSEDSDAENNLVEGEDKDAQGRYMDSDEESERFQAMFVDDRIDPASDIDDQNSERGFEDDDLPEWNDWSDGDGFQPMGSDSEECSECGDDGGACALPPKDDILPPSTTDKDAGVEEPIGSSVSQIHIYDLSKKATTDTTESGPDPIRLFHFKRDTQQILANSPPAIHPTTSLLVWPLGDNRILFADYLSNTYFVRKFQTSRFWSVHVSVNCRFSEDGNCLQVVAVEKSGKPPVLPARVKKGKKKAEEKKSKVTEEKPAYELIVSTYRMSQSKTTRVPPVLIGRVQKNLGELDVLPTVSWHDTDVYISLSKKTTCHIYRVNLGCPSTSKSKRGKQEKMTMQSFTADLPEWAVGRDSRYLPSEARSGEGQLIIMAEATKIPPYRPATPKESNKPSTSETSKTTSAADETSSTVSTDTKPEMNGTRVTNGDKAKIEDHRIDSAKTSESEPELVTQPTENSSEHVNGDADKGTDITAIQNKTVNASTPTPKNSTSTSTTTTETSSPTFIEPTSQPTATDTVTSSTSTPVKTEPKPEPTPNPYPNTMTTYLTTKLIKSFGGWRDKSCMIDGITEDVAVNGRGKCCDAGAGTCNGSDDKGDTEMKVLTFEYLDI